MKRVSVSVVALVCVLAAATFAQAPAPKPLPEHQKLAAFAGNWNYSGEAKPSPFGPGGKVTGTDHNELLGGFFLVRHYDEKGPMGALKGVEVVGYDATKKTYTDTSFDSSGASFAGTVTLNGNVWTFAGTSSMGGKSFQSRCALTMAMPATSFTVKCDSSPDGSKWTPTFEGQWKKATS